MTALPALIAKALTDSGYDLISPQDGSWFAAGISGSQGRVLIQIVEEGILLALPEADTAERIGLEISGVAAPAGMASVGLARGASHIYEALRMLHTLLTHPVAALSAKVEARLAAIPETERTREVRQRIGQDVFREALMDLWQGRCAVTGLALPSQLLRASHAKPWAKANHAERLDPFNGLLLSIHLDAMFDTGLIAFADDGAMLCSRNLDTSLREHYSISEPLQLRKHSPGHVPYLAWHRGHIFEGA
ncbi:HNH endonuclease [Pseudoxanthomonas mexicana]